MARKKPDIEKISQNTIPASITASNPNDFPIVYGDDIWDVAISGSGLANLMGNIGQYDQHSINEALANNGGVLEQNLKVSIDLGGITTKPTYSAGTSIESILRALLSPYVAFDYTVVGTASSGTFEYGTSKIISKFNITITDGTETPTSLRIGTTLDDDDLKSVSNPTSGEVALDSSITLDGTADTTYYFKMSDGTSDVRKTLSYNFPKYIYYGVVNSDVKPTSGVGLSSAQSVSEGVSLTTTQGSYIVFLTPTEMVNKQILQEAEQNIYVPLTSTTDAGSVTFTTNTGQSLTYYVYFSPEMSVGTGKFKIS